MGEREEWVEEEEGAEEVEEAEWAESRGTPSCYRLSSLAGDQPVGWAQTVLVSALVLRVLFVNNGCD